MTRALGALLALVATGIAPATAGEATASRHAYYLFLAGAPQGCEDCYVPLLVTRHILDEVALITTDERDSMPDKESLEDLVAAFRGGK